VAGLIQYIYPWDGSGWVDNLCVPALFWKSERKKGHRFTQVRVTDLSVGSCHRLFRWPYHKKIFQIVSDRNLSISASYQSVCPTPQIHPKTAGGTKCPVLLSTGTWLAQPCCNSAFGHSLTHVRQDHRSMAGPTGGSLLQFGPEYPVFGITPVATPKIIVFI